MPESKHRRKNRSHSAWRKARNNRRAQAVAANATKKRGMKQAMRVMQDQMADPFTRMGLPPDPDEQK